MKIMTEVSRESDERFLGEGARSLPWLALVSVLLVCGGKASSAQAAVPAVDGADKFAETAAAFIDQFMKSGPLKFWVAGLVVAGVLGFFLGRIKRTRPKQVEGKPESKAKLDLSGRYRALFENANDLIVGTGLDGQILYANDAWKSTLDFNDEEILSQSIFQMVQPESEQVLRSGYQRAKGSVKTKNLEVTLISKYGKRVIVEGSLHCEVENDEPVGLQCVFRDITERKRSASALKQSEERFTRVFAASPVAIAVLLKEGKLQDINQSFLTLLGYERDEIIGNTDTALGLWVNPADRDEIVEKLGRSLPVRDAQCKLRTKKGEVREALIAAELIEINAEPCLLLMIHDNTERLNLEGQLRQAQKMEGIGQLAAGVAHDFNNILTIIQGHASRLRDCESLPGAVGDSVEQVSIAADRAANLTRQLLTFCRKQAMLPEVMDLNKTVANVSKMLERILGEDIALEVQSGENISLINADSGMLELSIINLACNARDAMLKGGRLLITTSTADISLQHVAQQPKAKAGRHVCLTVTDTGCGMKPDTMRRIFEPFFTTKDVGKGTGLGLATVFGIVEQHHGWIEVASEVGKGTTFKIFLPQADRKSIEAVEQATPPTATGGKETILLVEDEEVLRKLAKMILEQYQYRVLEACSGVQALKVWAEHKDEIDMLLTDMVMPEGMTGRELAERLQVEKPKIKVLYSSGYSPDVVGGYFKLPENSFFLAKPYHPPKLAKAVRDCLDHASPGNLHQRDVAAAA